LLSDGYPFRRLLLRSKAGLVEGLFVLHVTPPDGEPPGYHRHLNKIATWVCHRDIHCSTIREFKDDVLRMRCSTMSFRVKNAVLFALLLACSRPCSLRAQVVDANVCDILANPQSFDGKTVRIKGTVVAGFEEFAIRGTDCNQLVNAIWLSYPQGSNGKAGPAAMLRLQLAKNNSATVNAVNRSPVSLDKNKDFKTFDNFLSTQAKTSGMCLGCIKFTVTATLVGRLDGAKDAGFIRDLSGKVVGLSGFGNLNRYNARLVLQSVSEVSSQEIDYSRPFDVSYLSSLTTDRTFVPGPASEDSVKRGADAFGGPGEHNGVTIGFRGANEVHKDDGEKAAADSPDGLSFDAIFDNDRLKGPAMQIALTHLGTHIADLRSDSPEVSNEIFYGAEFRAFQTTLVGALIQRVKELRLPGGYILYSQDWPQLDQNKDAASSIAAFLTNWLGLINPPKK
jgi:hypothetical protein